MAFTVFTFGDPGISPATLAALSSLLFGLTFSGGGTTVSSNYGWCN